MDNNKFIPFALPDIGEAEIKAVTDVMRSGWITTGPKTQEFELAFKDFLNKNNTHPTINLEAVAVNSATAGLHLALEAIGIKAGDEVIIPTLTFTATAEVIRYLGAHPIMMDCDPTTLNIAIDQIATKITAKTKAIIPVHFAGLACDMERILALARQYNLKVIEDAAHTLPSRVNEIMIGNHDSDAIVYSFYATKTITTGEGGMIVTKNSEIADRCRIMRLHGINRNAFDRYTAHTPSWYYEVIASGFKYNLTDIASALGLVQLSRVHEFHQRRTFLAQRYLQQLAGLPIIMPPQAHSPDIHSWHLFVIQINSSKISRDQFINQLSIAGIGSSVHFIPLHLHPVWRDDYKLDSNNFPAANQYYQNAVSLPLYTKMSDQEQNLIIKTIIKLLN